MVSVVGKATDSNMVLTSSFYPLVGAWCLSLNGPTVHWLHLRFSVSREPFSLFHHSVLI